MPTNDENLEPRVSALESEVRAELRAHRSSIQALRDTQLETQAEVRELRSEMRSGFAVVGAGMAEITDLLTRIAPEE